MTFTSYTARYRLDIGEEMREPGEPVPEAIIWFRMESYLHTGRIVEAPVSEDELRASITKFCPAEEKAILAKHGLKPLAEPAAKPVAKKAPAKKAPAKATG
jgi:hypothetical protein